MVESNPNDYTRRDVLALARVIDSVAWVGVPPDAEPPFPRSVRVIASLTSAARILAAGYRDCTVK